MKIQNRMIKCFFFYWDRIVSLFFLFVLFLNGRCHNYRRIFWFLRLAGIRLLILRYLSDKTSFLIPQSFRFLLDRIHYDFGCLSNCKLREYMSEYCIQIEPPVRKSEPTVAGNRASYCGKRTT